MDAGCSMLDARRALPATLRWEGGVAVACRLWADQAASLYPPATQETQQLVGATPAHQETARGGDSCSPGNLSRLCSSRTQWPH